ncbi:MAG: tyrosine--tRNA ligase, partial [candidate division Zixibacteria bacterium]|nr:tyrosine--tRNA ligase [candidate division Zixibacteria bacterium]
MLSKPHTEFDRQWQVIARGAVDLLPEDEFRAKLQQSLKDNKPLRVKQGFDPTSPDIHLGHAVGIRKLKQFQDLGHKIVLIVGDYTALVGDPSGQSATRPMLSYDKIMENAETYQKQFFRILDRSKTEICSNGDWFKKMDFREIMHLATTFTVARVLERDDFSIRMKNGVPISLHELFYPLMQGYDSVAIRADIEIGATEQKFNLLAGRVIQQAYGQPPQAILTLPILVGLDGEKKMSKSLGNYIGITDDPRDMFGKVMSIPDRLIYDYFLLTTEVALERLEDIKQQLSQPDINPMLLQKELGETLVDMYHHAGDGTTARDEFERVFSQKKLPDDIEELTKDRAVQLGLNADKLFLPNLLAKTGMCASSSEARSLIQSGSVYIVAETQHISFDEPVKDVKFEFPWPSVTTIIKVGKRR